MDEIEKALSEAFGIHYLMPCQETVIQRILENSRKKERSGSITILPTGTGKSLCFLLPAYLMKERYSILLYPLLSLMNDQARKLESLGIPYAMIRGGMDHAARKAELSKLRKKEAGILITNIESLIVSVERKEICFMKGNTELLVIDEAHTAVQWAESFRPSFSRLKEISGIIMPHQMLCFTATADESIISKLRMNVLSGLSTSILRLSADRQNIFYSARRSLSRRADVIDILSDPSSRPALVFCSYRSETEEFYSRIRGIYPSFYYHAGLPKKEKIEIENRFFISTDAVMFATNAYGMGVDKKNIRTVIHLHAPDDVASFLQEAGRGGRDNMEMRSIVLYSAKDRGRLKYVFSGKSCIRSSLLSLMGEETDPRCTSCSKCLDEDESASGEREIMDKVKRHRFIFSIPLLSWVLKLGKLRPWSGQEIRDAVKVLIEEGKIRKLLNRLY